eukprot:CAMPEP_0197592418 /NCGR_PEP_ID=MMETSP1326-20131121/15082_1 /TAXON_ID=1155430 /ORGANISM="Genus nov. species nov., Strain RCC2288" /LENGTH=59 /DNA_ID=CAMNT_0043158115 /DNA_START=131 /DNA_END=310 /DNA_ORIENTATION=+
MTSLLGFGAPTFAACDATHHSCSTSRSAHQCSLLHPDGLCGDSLGRSGLCLPHSEHPAQ